MQYTFDRFKAEISQALAATGLIGADEIDLQIPRAASVKADLALPCFKAAGTRGIKNPAQFAAQLAAAVQEQLPARTLIGAVQATGPFLNFSLDNRAFASQVLEEVGELGVGYGRDDRGAGQRAVFDYSAPNIARRMHVGHIRSTIIGQALVNLHRAQGYETVGDNHLGDWGTQFGFLIAAIARSGKPEGESDQTMAELEALYTRFSNAAKDDSALADEARSWGQRLEQGDPTARELWGWIVELTKRINQRNYDRLGVRFDTQHGESFYVSMSQQVIDDALARGVARHEQDGPVVVELEGLPTFVLQRSDEVTLYATRDIATVKYREQTYHPARIIYAVDARQELHFRQVFAAARALGYVRPEVVLVHVPFGTVFSPDGEALSTRRGNMIYLESLLDDAVSRARVIVESKLGERGDDLPAEEIQAIAEAVGIGGVIYNDLYQDPRRNITIDWERMLSLEGNSATYLQYTHARCRSIIRRAGGLPQDYDGGLLEHPAEQTVIRQLAQLPATVREATDRYSPYVVAEWLYTTAREFTVFYHACPVLEASSAELRAARLHLVEAVAQGLKNGLALLGITAPERM